MSTTAIVLMNVDTRDTNRVAEEIAAIPGISEVYSVAGNYDLVAVIRVADNSALADLVTDKVRHVAGVQRSQTLIAFRAYSKHDLDSLFDMD
jgi:DNA-binding Lrp family transcriptional regulator